ncbi:uncharacterized protein H6S33_003082 [Morchella sextelata]|uniref:uncharacterized protein n=1 Tax=Morchella sextelata TaxID=1174677 RepID=UPI001D055DDB|nr:uncharacterized protein H6S33_003082 [Morchella sextelata]KAH0607094.1 hypothetical protein H6S33_003082 [Morchella sextelata]
MARSRPEPVIVSASTSSSSSSSPEHFTCNDDGSNDFVMVPDDNVSLAALTEFRNMTVSPTDKLTVTHKQLSHQNIQHVSSTPSAYRLPPELLIAIFSKVSSVVDLRSCMLVSRQWANCSVELLWHRPSFDEFIKYQNMVKAVEDVNATYKYAQLIKRLNLTTIAGKISDGSMEPLVKCTKLERLTLTNCSHLTDLPLQKIFDNNPRIQALDLSQLHSITDNALLAVAKNCPRLQGLNIAGCKRVTDTSLIPLSERCKSLRRLKLNECNFITNAAVASLAAHCSQLLEIDLYKCHNITDEAIGHLFTQLRQLRELRLAYCDLLTDDAFLQLPTRTYDFLRILDLTGCELLTDEAVNKIVTAAPRLRNLVLAKCRNITDKAVTHSVIKLGKNLHYLHLGHCQHLTDRAVQTLVRYCNRIRYIDLACCTHLTDQSVSHLAGLPKLRRIGLVKCQNITDYSIQTLLKGNKDMPCPLERVHLSYCIKLTVDGIHELITNCQRLTHLSLTGVDVFYRRKDFTQFCRPPPDEFNEHQREVFCVFSGSGVGKLRNYLNAQKAHSEGTPNLDQNYYVDDEDNQDMDEELEEVD